MKQQDPDVSRKTINEEGFLRIWELELVISGAVIVALFQLPSAIDTLYNHVEMHISNEINMLPFMFYYLSKLLLYPLLLTFLLHFFLRGFWIGLIGLSLIFPNGVNWEKLDFPPIQEQMFKEERYRLKWLQEKIDKLCSSLFSILFMILILFIWLGLLNLACVPLSLILKKTILPHISLSILFVGSLYVLIFVLMGHSLLAAIFDKRLKKKPHLRGKYPGLEKAARFSFRFSNVVSLGFMWAPILMTFRSNLKKGFAMTGFFGIFIIFPAIFMFNLMVSRGFLVFESYPYFPRNSTSQGINPLHYDNLRQPNTLFTQPSIQSDMIKDKFIRLFLPFSAKKDNQLMLENCPDIKPYRPDGFVMVKSAKEETRNQEILGCLTELYSLALNGQPMEGLTFSFFTHPVTQVKGLVTYIPTSRGVEGQNFLKITKKKLKEDLEEEAEDEALRKKNSHLGTWYIPFFI